MKRLRRIFMSLAKVNSPSFKENRITPTVLKSAFSNGFRVSMDDDSNVIVVRRNSWAASPKKKLPLLCAHMDNISHNPKNLRREVFYDHTSKIISTVKGHVLGGDDKCGMAIIMRLMELAPRYGYEFIGVFTRGEERGQGANKLNKVILKEAEWALVLDRRNKSDVVVEISRKKLCSDKFARWVCRNAPVGTNAKPISSCFSDALPLARAGLSNVVNLSVGYYNPHSTKEIVKLDELHNTMLWVENMIRPKAA